MNVLEKLDHLSTLSTGKKILVAAVAGTVFLVMLFSAVGASSGGGADAEKSAPVPAPSQTVEKPEKVTKKPVEKKQAKPEKKEKAKPKPAEQRKEEPEVKTTEKPKAKKVEKPAPAPEPPKVEETIFYENCDAVRAAGADPVYEGEPGYASHLDRDGNGVGCQ